MSEPVIKGAKRPASRPAPESPPKSAAKSRKLTGKPAARPAPIAKRSSAEKSPVRKAATPKSVPHASAGKGGARPAKPAKSAPITARSTGKTNAKPRPATPTTPSKTATQSKATTKTTARTPVKQPVKSTPAKKLASTTKGRASTPLSTPRPSTKPSGVPAQPRQPTRDEAAALRSFERAHKEFTRGRFAEARNLFRSLIEQHAGVSEVTARARTYLSIAEARLRSESALPRDAEALYDRGVIELNRGDYVAAQELFERALKRDEQSADTHYALAATRSRLGSIQLALESLERALSLRPNLRVRAQHDADLTALRNEPDYERLIFPSRG